MRGRRPNIIEKISTKIKKRIVASGDEGISQKMLCKELGIPRMSAYRYCKWFEDQGEIKVVREGRGARYVAKSKIVMDPEIGSYAQGRQAYFKIIRNRRSPPITTPALGTDDTSRLTDLEVGLFNFSNIIGALFTYILLQAMTQGNPILHREYHRKGTYNMNHRKKDRLVRQWIDGFLSGILTSTPYELRDLIYEKTGYYLAHTKEDIKLFDRKEPRLYLDDPEVVWLGREAFRNIYPGISKILDGISTQLPKVVYSQKAAFEAFEKSGRSSLNELLVQEAMRNKEKQRVKQTHDHEFKLLDVKAGVKYFECKICGKKKSELTRTL